jgi:membrane-anchored protein YejM (alkaline phosphatase superfamily)
MAAYARGVTTASPELLAQAGRSPEQFVEGGIPHWVYPIWMLLTSTIVLLSARRIQGWRWAATAVTSIYLAYRVIGWLLLSAFSFPVSFIPAMLLPLAFVIDLAASRRWSALVTALALVGIAYPLAALIGSYTLMPEFALDTAPIVLLVLWGGLAAADWWRRRSGKIAMQAV